MIQGPGGQTALPSHVASASASPAPSSILAPFLLHLVNGILGLIGLGIILYGTALALRIIWQHYRGDTIRNYHHQWQTTPRNAALPPVSQALLMIALGFIVVGFVLSGLWVAVINALIAVGQHIDTQIAHHLKGGSSSSTSG